MVPDSFIRSPRRKAYAKCSFVLAGREDDFAAVGADVDPRHLRFRWEALTMVQQNSPPLWEARYSMMA